MDEEAYEDFFAQMFGGGGGFGGPPPGMGGRPRQRRKTQTAPSEVELPVTLEELFVGCEKAFVSERERTCGGCKGSGAKPGRQPKPCVRCNGQGQTYAMKQMGAYMARVPIACPLCRGQGVKVRDQDACVLPSLPPYFKLTDATRVLYRSCKKCKGARTVKEKKKLEFFLERGMHAGEKIMLKGEGDESVRSLSYSPLQHPSD